MRFRTGIGYDLHRLGPGRPLLLGGVQLPSALGLLGHSAGDVVLHALGAALPGAAGLGAIGGLFPDAEPATKGPHRRRFVVRTLRARGPGGCRW